MSTIDALECSIIHGVSRSTWRNWGRRDHRWPRPIFQDGRTVRWDKAAVIEYLDIRKTEQNAKALAKTQSKGRHPPERSPRASQTTRKKRKKQLLLDAPKAYATSNLSVQLFEVHRRIDGRHELFDIDVGGCASETGVEFSKDEREMLEQFRAWACDNLPSNCEVSAYQHPIIKGDESDGCSAKEHAPRGSVGMREEA